MQLFLKTAHNIRSKNNYHLLKRLKKFGMSIPSTLVTCNWIPLQNAPFPALAVNSSSVIGLYTMPISACIHQRMQILCRK